MKRRRGTARQPKVATPATPNPALQQALDRVADALCRMADDMTHARAVHAIETNAQMARSGVDRAGSFQRIAAVAIARLASEIIAKEFYRRTPTPLTHAAASARALEETDHD